MINPAKYRQFLSEFVRQHMIVLGPALAVDTANRVEGLEVDKKGAVTQVTEEPASLTSELVGEFSKLSSQTTSYITHNLFTRYPDIAEEFPDTLPKSNFICALIRPKT